MPVDINGYALSNAGGLSFGTSGTKVVASTYGIRDPMLPTMFGSAGLAGAYKVYPFPVNALDVNIGGCWSTVTYRFTAPVAGIYYTSYGGITGDGTAAAGAGYYAIIVNGTNVAFSYRNTDNTWELHHVEVMLNLQAGDWLAWAMNTAPGPVGGSAGAYQSNHNNCTIWLVG